LGHWHGFCKRKSMKKTKFISTILFATAFSFAAGESTAPAADVPTPAERQSITKESPNLGQKEREDWIRMREERKQAREEILSRLRESPAGERQNIRQDLSRNRDERPRFEGDFPKYAPREPEHYERRPESRDQDFMQGQNDPPPKRDPMRR